MTFVSAQFTTFPTSYIDANGAADIGLSLAFFTMKSFDFEMRNKETSMYNAINWFEIPAADFDRAVDFYHKVLETAIRKEIFGGMPNGIFVTDGEGAVGGAIVKGEGYTPTTSGSVVYLNAKTPDYLDRVLARVEPAGGKVLLPKTHIGAPGFIALILDTEGNRVGLHSPN